MISALRRELRSAWNFLCSSQVCLLPLRAYNPLGHDYSLSASKVPQLVALSTQKRSPAVVGDMLTSLKVSFCLCSPYPVLSFRWGWLNMWAQLTVREEDFLRGRVPIRWALKRGGPFLQSTIQSARMISRQGGCLSPLLSVRKPICKDSRTAVGAKSDLQPIGSQRRGPQACRLKEMNPFNSPKDLEVDFSSESLKENSHTDCKAESRAHCWLTELCDGRWLLFLAAEVW